MPAHLVPHGPWVLRLLPPSLLTPLLHSPLLLHSTPALHSRTPHHSLISKPQKLNMITEPLLLPFLYILLLLPTFLLAASPYPHRFYTQRGQTQDPLSASKRNEGSSNLVHLRYHMGPVLSSPIRLYLLWYGAWDPTHQSPIRDFLLSLSDSTLPHPSASDWWATVSLYSDQTNSNSSRSISVAREWSDPTASLGRHLTRLGIQRVVSTAVRSGRIPADHLGGAYLILTAPDITVQDFCRAACGFHYFTFPSLVGHTLPYAWIGHSGSQCPEVCAYPFAIPSYMAGAMGPMRPPNGDPAIDGMVSVVAHEMAEMVTNPLVNAWYAGEDPTAPTEIADLCEGVYGSGGGGGYAGQVSKDGEGRSWNLNGRNGRRFMVQWVWSPVLSACAGPNAID